VPVLQVKLSSRESPRCRTTGGLLQPYCNPSGQYALHSARSLALHIGQHVRVGIQGYGDGGTTEKFLHYLRIYCKPWFDPERGTLMLGEYIVEMDSYRGIVGDQAGAAAELDSPTQRVVSLLRQLEVALRRRPQPSPPRRCAGWRCSTLCKSSACKALPCYRGKGGS